MRYLHIQPKFFLDETLESYLIRLYQANHFNNFNYLALAVKESMSLKDSQSAGAFPLNLKLINVYHANTSSSYRIRALSFFEAATKLKPFTLLNQSLIHSLNKLAGDFRAVRHHETFYPLCFIDRESVGVCPHCIDESPYIRQCWHIKHLNACHKHGCQLVRQCNFCGTQINYMETESITQCACGFEFKNSKVIKANSYDSWFANLLVGNKTLGKFSQESSSILSLLLWFKKYKNIDDAKLIEGFHAYFNNWPNNFHSELNELTMQALSSQLLPFNKTSFSDVFGNLLLISRNLPNWNNLVMTEIVRFLVKLVYCNPRGEQPNIADISLSALEVAALLNQHVEEIYRLYEEGYLKMSVRLPKHERLAYHQPAFFLRQTVELMQAGYGNFVLPAW